jgi:hypothetical protein
MIDAANPAKAVINGFLAPRVYPSVFVTLMQQAVHTPRPAQRGQELPGSGVKTGFGKPRHCRIACPNRCPTDKQYCHKDHFAHLKLLGSCVSPDHKSTTSGESIISPPPVICQVFFGSFSLMEAKAFRAVFWLGANTHLNQNTATNSHPPPCPVSQVLSARLRSSPLPPA